MIFGSLFSGIGAPEAAWQPLGWRCAWTAEIDPFASAVLAHHFPKAPNLGDVTKVDWNAVEPVELVVFGSPCQSFSIAGKRLGLDDPRGNLALVALRAVERIRPAWVVFENVPGLLSSDEGRDFGAFLGILGQCGYGFAYRILDAQFAGVPQRRRRVFVVGYLGDWRPPAAVLLEPESLRGDPPPRRTAGQETARPLASCPQGGSGYRADADTADSLIPILAQSLRHSSSPNGYGYSDGLRGDDGADNLIAATVLGGAPSGNGPGHRARSGDSKDSLIVADTVRSHPRPGSNSLGNIAFDGNNTSGPIDVATACNAHGGPHGRLDFETETFVTIKPRPLDTDGFTQAVAFAENSRAEVRLQGGNGLTAGSLKAGGGKAGQSYPAIQQAMSVRRLTPREAERLQGFPDGWTAIIYCSKTAADGPRYRALGNAMAVPVVRWIGQRIQMFEDLQLSLPLERKAAE